MAVSVPVFLYNFFLIIFQSSLNLFCLILPCVNLHLFNVPCMSLCFMVDSWSGCRLSAKSHDCKASPCSLLPNQLVKVHFHYCVLNYFYTWCLVLHWGNYLIQYRIGPITLVVCELNFVMGLELSSQNIATFSARNTVLRLDGTWINCQRKITMIIMYYFLALVTAGALCGEAGGINQSC